MRGAGPLRLRREKSALKRSEIGWVESNSNSHRNFSISDEHEATSFSEFADIERLTKIVRRECGLMKTVVGLTEAIGEFRC